MLAGARNDVAAPSDARRVRNASATTSVERHGMLGLNNQFVRSCAIRIRNGVLSTTPCTSAAKR